MPWLLDTNVLSELRRPRPDPRVIAFVSSCPLDELYVSTVVFAEIRFGIALVQDAALRADLNAWLENTIRPMFTGRVLDMTEDVMLRWRLLIEEGRKVGRTYSQPDLMIAATAHEHNLTLVTRNVRDFAELGLTLLNPWQ
ncbi:type II toxin-antitoxin system VapC family toxin [Granulicella sibirica]|uniref:Ribonuclease VapC n=1 Tax=Granulicella sibirica TaxID=2479048 RepID=A0A4Q0SU12_9BACT|nr:type II toxin-antitoxin system VapC family toxin [Granulicella sibirica]RXH54177.1 VapC toxin protein [Granulicella sibirica]